MGAVVAQQGRSYFLREQPFKVFHAMYESHFHLRHRPFLVAPSVERYFPGHAIEHARQTLARCIERAQGPALLIGPAGTGKSLVCQLLAEQFRHTFAVALLANTKLCTRRALLQSILFELDLPYRDLDEGELRLSLIDFLEPSGRSRQGLLLVIDEAHTLPWRLIEEVRMITNLVRNGQPRIRLVLAGGPQLEERFASPKLDSFNQRIAARCYLQSFSREETYAYVRSQIAAVGGVPAQVFSESALRAIFAATDGIPRLINQVCDYAMLLTSVAGKPTVENNAVEEAWADLQQLPAPWQTSTAQLPLPTPSSILEFGTLDEISETNEATAAVPMPLTPPAPEPAPLRTAHEAHPFSPLETEPSPSEQLDEIEMQMAKVYADEYPAITLDDFGYAPRSVLTSQEIESLRGEDAEEATEAIGAVEAVSALGTSADKLEEWGTPENPFGDFSEEEVVIDGLPTCGSEWLHDRTQVSCPEGREFAATLKSLEESRQHEASALYKSHDELGKEAAAELLVELNTPFLEEQLRLDIPAPQPLLPITFDSAIESKFDPASDPVFPEPMNPEPVAAELMLPETADSELLAEEIVEEDTAIDEPMVAEPMSSAPTCGACEYSEPNYREPTFVEPVFAESNFDGSSCWSTEASAPLSLPVTSEPLVCETSESAAHHLSEVESFIAAANGAEFHWPELESKPVTPVRTLPKDDRDLLVIDEEPELRKSVPVPTNKGPVRRQEYRQLFAKLRRS